MRSVTAVFERDESGTWIVTVPRVKGCHSYGRTLEQARRHVREALRLFDVGDVEITERVRLPSDWASRGSACSS